MNGAQYLKQNMCDYIRFITCQVCNTSELLIIPIANTKINSEMKDLPHEYFIDIHICLLLQIHHS